jgi:DNA-binding transcriptional regulator YhcF (GntR family)
MNEVCISLDKNSKIKLYRQLYDKIVEFINTGIYKPDQKLPSLRLLSAQLDISKNTITKTYDELGKDNYIYSLIKKGYFVQNRNLLKDNVVPSSEEQDNESESSVPTVDSIIKQHKEPIFSTTALDESQEETDTITPQTVTVKQEVKPSITQSLLAYVKSISTSKPNTV